MSDPSVSQAADKTASNDEPLTLVQPKGKRPAHVMPTVRIATKKQFDILRAYGVAGENGRPVGLKEVAEIVKLHPGTVTYATPFFKDTGVLLKAATPGFAASPEVIAYSRAYQWNLDTAARELAPVFSKTWFARTLMTPLSYSGSMKVEDAISKLAQVAAATPEYRSHLEVLLEFLEGVGIILREGDMIRKTNYVASVGEPEFVAAATPTLAPAIEPQRSASLVPGTGTAFQSTQGKVRFNVSVDLDMSEFAGWRADRITAFFGGIAQVLAAKANIEQESADEG